jgi:hypothetical protein
MPDDAVKPKVVKKFKSPDPAAGVAPAVAVSDHKFLRLAVVGETFSGVYQVLGVQERLTVTSKPYSDVLVADRSGRQSIRIWGTKASEIVKKGDWCRIEVNVEEYLGQPQFVGKVEKADAPVSMTDYIPYNEFIEQDEIAFTKLRGKVTTWCESLNDKTCKMLLDTVFTDTFLEKYCEAPGSDRPCYGRIGGALAKTVRISQSVASTAAHYRLDLLEGAVALTSALLYSVGCVRAYEFENLQSIETREGTLFGAGFMTAAKIAAIVKHLETNEGFNAEVGQRIIHAIASSSRCGPKPATKDAVALAAAVHADYETAQAVDFIDSDQNPDEEFTAWDPTAKRKYFKRKVFGPAA